MTTIYSSNQSMSNVSLNQWKQIVQYCFSRAQKSIGQSSGFTIEEIDSQDKENEQLLYHDIKINCLLPIPKDLLSFPKNQVIFEHILTASQCFYRRFGTGNNTFLYYFACLSNAFLHEHESLQPFFYLDQKHTLFYEPKAEKHRHHKPSSHRLMYYLNKLKHCYEEMIQQITISLIDHSKQHVNEILTSPTTSYNEINTTIDLETSETSDDLEDFDWYFNHPPSIVLQTPQETFLELQNHLLTGGKPLEKEESKVNNSEYITDVLLIQGIAHSTMDLTNILHISTIFPSLSPPIPTLEYEELREKLSNSMIVLFAYHISRYLWGNSLVSGLQTNSFYDIIQEIQLQQQKNTLTNSFLPSFPQKLQGYLHSSVVDNIDLKTLQGRDVSSSLFLTEGLFFGGNSQLFHTLQSIPPSNHSTIQVFDAMGQIRTISKTKSFQNILFCDLNLSFLSFQSLVVGNSLSANSLSVQFISSTSSSPSETIPLTPLEAYSQQIISQLTQFPIDLIITISNEYDELHHNICSHLQILYLPLNTNDFQTLLRLFDVTTETYHSNNPLNNTLNNTFTHNSNQNPTNSMNNSTNITNKPMIVDSLTALQPNLIFHQEILLAVIDELSCEHHRLEALHPWNNEIIYGNIEYEGLFVIQRGGNSFPSHQWHDSHLTLYHHIGILLCSPLSMTLTTYKDRLYRCLHRIRLALESDAIVLGGGSSELYFAIKTSDFVTKTFFGEEIYTIQPFMTRLLQELSLYPMFISKNLGENHVISQETLYQTMCLWKEWYEYHHEHHLPLNSFPPILQMPIVNNVSCPTKMIWDNPQVKLAAFSMALDLFMDLFELMD